MDTLERAEKIREFNDQMLKEDMKSAHERRVRATWCVELFEHSNGLIELPYSVNYGSEHITQYHDRPKKVDEDGWEYEDYDAPREIDVDGTNNVIAIIVQFARSKNMPVKYKHTDEEFVVTVTLDEAENSYNNVTLAYRANRQSVCKQVKTTVQVEAQVIEAHEEEVVSWDCQKVSFLAMETSIEA